VGCGVYAHQQIVSRGTTVLARLGLNSFFKIILGWRDEHINNTGTSLSSAGQADRDKSVAADSLPRGTCWLEVD